MIDGLGARLVSDGHADITMIEEPGRLQQLLPFTRPGEFIIPYRVRLPYGSISIGLRNRNINAVLFGNKPLLASMPAFLEGIAGRGLKRLEDASKSKSGISDKLSEAVKYRLVADIVTAAASSNIPRAALWLRTRYPFGISDGRIRHALVLAERALQNMTRIPKLKGLIVGSFLAALLDGLWFAVLRALIDAGILAVVADFLLVFLNSAVIVFAMKAAVQTSLRTALGPISQKKKTIRLKPGHSMISGFAAGAVVYGLMLTALYRAGLTAPEWLNSIF